MHAATPTIVDARAPAEPRSAVFAAPLRWEKRKILGDVAIPLGEARPFFLAKDLMAPASKVPEVGYNIAGSPFMLTPLGRATGAFYIARAGTEARCLAAEGFSAHTPGAPILTCSDESSELAVGKGVSWEIAMQESPCLPDRPDRGRQ